MRLAESSVESVMLSIYCLAPYGVSTSWALYITPITPLLDPLALITLSTLNAWAPLAAGTSPLETWEFLSL